MPVVEKRNLFSGIPVSEAMRQQVVSLPISATIGQGIRKMIRNKANAVLITDNDIPRGVVSKTDLVGALYAELPTESPLQDVMVSPPIACFRDDSLEDALGIMAEAGAHRLYVIGASREEVIGVLAYSEIVGLLYRYCRACERGTAKRRIKLSQIDPAARLSVKDVMTHNLWACQDQDQLTAVIEILSAQQLGAVLIQDQNQSPVGVISKTDLIVAYNHGLSAETEARQIMSSPVHSVASDELLSSAIQRMLVWDVQRLFVHRAEFGPGAISGVLALSDSARFLSGSCRACTASRMLIS